MGAINNAEELVERNFASGGRQFMAMSSGKVNTTELVAALINQKDDFVSGIKHAQESIDGSLTLLIITQDGQIIAARDKVGRLPVLIGKIGLPGTNTGQREPNRPPISWEACRSRIPSRRPSRCTSGSTPWTTARR